MEDDQSGDDAESDEWCNGEWCNLFQLKYLVGLIPEKINLNSYIDDGQISCFLEVDWIIKLHYSPNGYAPASKK